MGNGQQPAFPSLYEDEHGQQGTIGGLTKREYFAVKAMQGFTSKNEGIDPSYIAKWSIKCADELLRQLEQ